ncbi:MAG: hypothetical protein HY267_04515 [Deltaproteobacteria bacterium]|nr:hypothetical protein [Deltaproteobacteria bacterium]
MNRNHITISAALVLMLTGAVGAAEAKTQQVHCKGGGTFTDGVETNIDTNSDGVSAGIDQGAEVCNIGSFVFQEEIEWIPRPITSACPAGTTEELYVDSTHGQHRSVVTDEKTGDQLFVQLTSGTICLNFSSYPSLPFPFTDSVHGEFIGGTGKYTGATGTFDSHAVGSYLQFGFKGGTGAFGGFGQFTFTTDGTLTLPKGKDD